MTAQLVKEDANFEVELTPNQWAFVQEAIIHVSQRQNLTIEWSLLDPRFPFFSNQQTTFRLSLKGPGQAISESKVVSMFDPATNNSAYVAVAQAIWPDKGPLEPGHYVIAIHATVTNASQQALTARKAYLAISKP
jgi:hypothetical protein